MSSSIDELKSAINEGDLDRATKIIFSLTKDGKEILIPSKPLFARIKESKAEVKSGLPFKKDKQITEIETIEVYLYYPIWVLMLVIERNLANNNISIEYEIKAPGTLGGSISNAYIDYQPPMKKIK